MIVHLGSKERKDASPTAHIKNNLVLVKVSISQDGLLIAASPDCVLEHLLMDAFRRTHMSAPATGFSTYAVHATPTPDQGNLWFGLTKVSIGIEVVIGGSVFRLSSTMKGKHCRAR